MAPAHQPGGATPPGAGPDVVVERIGAATSYLGLRQAEMRSWVGWSHPLTLVGRAPRFVTLAWTRLSKRAGTEAGPDGARARGDAGGAGAEAPEGDRSGG
jgi:hypothetical protein